MSERCHFILKNKERCKNYVVKTKGAIFCNVHKPKNTSDVTTKIVKQRQDILNAIKEKELEQKLQRNDSSIVKKQISDNEVKIDNQRKELKQGNLDLIQNQIPDFILHQKLQEILKLDIPLSSLSENELKNRKIYIASMNMRGIHSNCNNNLALKINVTSAQRTGSKYRSAFSPMHVDEYSAYKGYACFENYWQSGKVYQSIPHNITRRWWKEQKEAHRRYPKSKDIKILCAKFEDYGDVEMDYITSRKKVYVPEYYEKIKHNKVLREIINMNEDIIISDFDGPRDIDGNPICLEITKELLISKINDTRHPFGHGYIIAGIIAGYLPNDYVL